jgi:hypothetical protein
MRNLQRRLQRLELRRRPNREPRVVTRFERLDGGFEVWESRPAEENDETVEIRVEYVDRPPKAS